jgi:hypothetical protein
MSLFKKILLKIRSTFKTLMTKKKQPEQNWKTQKNR